MIKIASITPYKIVPAVKGGEKGIFYFLKYLAKYVSVTAFTVTENTGMVNGIRFEPLLGGTSQKLRYVNPWLYFTIKKECRRLGIKHVIVEHPYYAWLGYALKKFAGLKLIFHSHNIEAERFRTMNKRWWKIMYLYERFAHRVADFNFFISQEDREHAINEYGVKADKSAVITYGIEAVKAPAEEERAKCKKIVCEELGLPVTTRLILFNGTLDYAPNRAGLNRILDEINPLLLSRCKTPYSIVICGLRLPATYKDLKAYTSKNIIYKGFVADIDLYFKAADLFINPITDGGGIKTKLVEALAADTPAVSFKAGAYGIPAGMTGHHLATVEDGDSTRFANAVIDQLEYAKEPIPLAFYEHFSWDAIAKKAVNIVSRL